MAIIYDYISGKLRLSERSSPPGPEGDFDVPGTLTAASARVAGAVTVGGDLTAAGVAVTALPTGGGILTGCLYRLTTADDTAKAAPGLYVHNGTAWFCKLTFAAYAIGASGAAQTFPAIFDALYTMTVSEALALTFPAIAGAGTISIRLTNGGAFAITWDADVEWASGASPVLTAAGVDLLIFVTADGTTWTGALSMGDAQ